MSITSDIDAIVMPDELPVLPVKDVVLFPSVILPLFVGRDSSIQAVNHALEHDRLIFLSAQKDGEANDVDPEGIHKNGCVGIIMRMHKLPVPDGRIKILVQGVRRATIQEFTKTSPNFFVKIKEVPSPDIEPERVELEAMMRSVREVLEKIVSHGKILSPEILIVLDDVKDPGRLADLVASYLVLKIGDAQPILEMVHPKQRLQAVLDHLHKELDILSVQEKIQTQARGEMTRIQREYYLREQLRAIKSELGDGDPKAEEIHNFRKKLDGADMPSEVEEEAHKQLKRLESMHPDAAEASIVRTYLEWLIELPWSTTSSDNINITKAKEILDKDHYDLEKVKDRILEFLSVTKLKKKLKGPILCFAGPPGVGKTSLGKSIAKAMGREFVRVSVGGMRDEAEIRGHRRTYVGAMPGRVIQGIKQAGKNNPVFIFDEVDKLGSDSFRGDPSSALLEVLDPEQNNTFRDHYLNLPYDLSNVMFIATANMIDTIPAALRDRMEIIHIPGYTLEEKIEISKLYLIDKQIDANGLKAIDVTLKDEGVREIVASYTREAGLRNLERKIASVFRKIARKVAEGFKGKVVIGASDIQTYLGPPIYIPENRSEINEVGVTTGLAWTSGGGEVLFVETTLMDGKGSLTLTGQLGDVMKESAQAALSYARANSKRFGIKKEYFYKKDLHVHVPAGAIPKDGPSAGVTMVTSLVSALTGKPVSRDVAMTGEITLRGRVLAIGGLKEKILAAKRANITKILIPHTNEKDLYEIPDHYLNDLEIVPVKTIDEVLAHAIFKIKPIKAKAKKKTKKKTAKKKAVVKKKVTLKGKKTAKKKTKKAAPKKSASRVRPLSKTKKRRKSAR